MHKTKVNNFSEFKNSFKINEEDFPKIQSSEYPKVFIEKLRWSSEYKKVRNEKKKLPDNEVEQLEQSVPTRVAENHLSNDLNDKSNSDINLSIPVKENIVTDCIEKDKNSFFDHEETRVCSFTCGNCDFESEYTSSKGCFKFVHECISFKCLICSLVFHRKQDIEKHTAIHLSDSASTSIRSCFKEESLGSLSLFRSSQKIKCSRCSFECNNKNTFENHMVKHSDNIQQLKVNLISCNKVANNIAKPRVRKESVPKRLKCPDCDFEINNKDDLADHLPLHEPKYISCSRCKFETNDIKLLERHLVIHEPDRNKCPRCDFESGEKEILGQHLLTHEGVYVQCPSCSFICSCKSSFNIHLLNHEPALFQCSKCDLFCNQKLDFKNHMSKHYEIYNCSKCVFFSFNKKELDRHSQEHKEMIFKCSRCQFKGSNKEELEDHLLLHYQGEVFECTECSFVTSVESELKDHMKVHFYHCYKCHFKSISSKGKRVKHECLKQCPFCDFKGPRLDKHQFMHREQLEYKCLQCRYVTNKKSSFEKHRSKHPKIFKCAHCNFECKMLETYLRHLRKHTKNILKCDLCDYETIYSNKLKTHYNKHSTLKIFKCSKCNYECKLKRTLKNHMSIHTGVYKYNCSHCSYKTSYRELFTSHIETHSESKEFICSQCNFSTKTAQSLNSHIRVHRDKKRYKCEKCDYDTNYKHNLKTHVLKHTNVRLFNCDQCDYTSNYKFCIERHVQITHDKDAKEKEVSNANEGFESGEEESSKSKQLHHCPQCDYTTSYIGNLRVHKITSHSKKEDYSCPHCKYSTTSKDSLDLHSVDHLEVLKCFYCDFTPDSKPDLREHILQHQKTSTKKEFECDDCGFVSTSRVSFNQHKKTHLKNKELKCTKCKYATNFTGNLTKHIKSKHPDEKKGNVMKMREHQ